MADSVLELGVRVELDDDVAVLRCGEGDRVRRFAVVLLLRVDERVVAHLSLVVSEDGLCAALGGADAREVPPERHAFRRCLNVFVKPVTSLERNFLFIASAADMPRGFSFITVLKFGVPMLVPGVRARRKILLSQSSSRGFIATRS